MHGQQNIILRCTVSKTLYWVARSAKHYTEMHGQQNIILRCTASKTLYWDARSAKHYTEMHGQQNINWDARHGQQNIILRCMVSKTYWDARSAKHYTEMHGQQNIILRCTVSKTLTEMHGTVSKTLYWDARSAKHEKKIMFAELKISSKQWTHSVWVIKSDWSAIYTQIITTFVLRMVYMNTVQAECRVPPRCCGW
jgi:hypothetical protein